MQDALYYLPRYQKEKMTFHNVQFLQKVNHQGQKQLLPKNIFFTLKTECEKTNFIIIEPLFKQRFKAHTDRRRFGNGGGEGGGFKGN